MMRILAAAAVLSLGAAPLGACGSSTTTQVDTATTGQELVDLKKAYDEGVITKSEYERKRKEILRK
ncbi:SHOCT domain-containing protein [Phenylobacterium sp.]|uniref:SHOCT domain-containing protein n=1 Tax=Phenylobacterium sp. TaxID=1871053 RepID=UPI0028A049BA|nr:SHOCT domain-containing protein [Phenylobacterium sp.]